MNRFENVRFCGTFRDYQQRVLDQADAYLSDGRIHIVAAPGSGKTVLGLELIRRIGAPCIILSPTTAIREQWGQRFRDMFLADAQDFPALFSSDLHQVRLVNSITYQALYTAIEKVAIPESEDETDLSDVDMVRLLREHRIGTICLDEAHHLRNEWQKALEAFVGLLGEDIKIISLTATPPYDAESAEWNRYAAICGEIDQEIFVPELVAQNTLCPHQDYVYFNYPSQQEIDSFRTYRENAAAAVQQIGKLPLWATLWESIQQNADHETLFSNVKGYVALLTLMRHYGFSISRKLVRELTAGRGLPFFKMAYAETALQFLLGGELITEEEKDALCRILKNYAVYEKRKISLTLNEKLKRTLISSVGKLESIRQIAKSETATMGTRLRMLILTDYIKKENTSKIATEEAFNSVNVISIFETLRRTLEGTALGVLSGSLVILPETIDLSELKHKKQSIPGTGYCTVEFSGSTHACVAFVGKCFARGDIQILVGTKSLLGEGWDSPCINSLILASFVGSFVLSNQMRGRAIRIDSADPQKTANIWHLVTVEPEHLLKDKAHEQLAAYLQHDPNKLNSWDFEVLTRRFDAFMGPNYTTGRIESGIERITAIKAPFDPAGIQRINREMLQRSGQRESVYRRWSGEVADGHFDVVTESAVDEEKRIPVFTFSNVALVVLLLSLQQFLLQSFLNSARTVQDPSHLLYLAAEAGLLCCLYPIIKKWLLHSNPARSIKTLGQCVFKAMQECSLVSGAAKVVTKQDKELKNVAVHLRNASLHDQNVFNAAMAEMLSPIENPRYILIRKNLFGRYDYSQSFACPTVIGRKKEYAQALAVQLKKTTGNFDLVYTHKDGGRKLILKCRKRSYITYNQKQMKRKYKVSHWE